MQRSLFVQNLSSPMAMCKDESDILMLSFENRCQCKGCPGEIQQAIMSFDGVRELRSLDYKKGTAELIVEAEVAENPQQLCKWILKKAKKHAEVANSFGPFGRSFNKHDDFGDFKGKGSQEKFIYRERREVHEVRIINTRR